MTNPYRFALDGEGRGQGGLGDFLLQETGDLILIDDDPIGLETGDNVLLESFNCNDDLLLETGDVVLLETGDKILTEGTCSSFLIMEQNRMLL